MAAGIGERRRVAGCNVLGLNAEGARGPHGHRADSREFSRSMTSIRVVLFVDTVSDRTVRRRTEGKSPMSTATNTQTAGPDRTASSTQPVRRIGLVAGVVASIATTVVAALADAAGVSLDVADEAIPLSGFATLTMVGAVIGIVMAAALARRARHPRRVFVRATVVLTVLSLVPDVAVDAHVATRIVLGVTHIVAAGIIIPAIARRLS
jgi:Family of unknown function (DUF6069)